VKRIALYVNASRPYARETARRVELVARARGIAVTLCEGTDVELGFSAPVCDFENAELLVTVGGDGTLLRGTRLVHELEIPIFGINTGRLGFLTEVESDDNGFRALERVFDGDVEYDERIALHAFATGSDEEYFALNEVVVRRVTQARLAPFGLALDGELIVNMPSDGIIVATPTGSTAYFLSAGGPIIQPGVEALGVAGLMPHALFARPLIVSSAASIEITCSGELTRANLETDGFVARDLRAGDRVTVRRAEKCVRFARIRRGAFFTRLEEKLQWGVPIKSM
jgi:NAD+ kinase